MLMSTISSVKLYKVYTVVYVDSRRLAAPFFDYIIRTHQVGNKLHFYYSIFSIYTVALLITGTI